MQVLQVSAKMNHNIDEAFKILIKQLIDVRAEVSVDLAFLLLSFGSLVTVNVMSQWLVVAVPWVWLQCLIVAFPGHTHFLFKAHLQPN